jgi:hypothetical protein
MSTKHGNFLHRVWPAVSTIALAGAVTMLITKPAEGTQPNGLQELKALQEIEDLEYCYAAGTDAIGRGDLQGGKQIYAQCFTQDAPIVVTAAGADPNDPPAVSLPNPNAWADLIDGLFVDAGYVSTQHLISNIRIDIHSNGHEATITSYLSATHVLDPVSSIQVAHGTYESEAVKTPGGWKLKKRMFRTLTFLRLESPLP